MEVTMKKAKKKVAKKTAKGKARNACTGKYATKKYAAQHPDTTVVESR